MSQFRANTKTRRISEKVSQQLSDADALLFLVAQSLGLADWREDPVRVCKELTSWPDLRTADRKLNRTGKEAVLQLLKIENWTEAGALFNEWAKGPEVISVPGAHERSMVSAPVNYLGVVTAELDRGTGKYDAFLAKLLIAGWYVGLSPHEWIKSHLESGKIVFPDANIPDYLAVRLDQIHPAGRHVVESVLQEFSDLRRRGHALPKLFKALRDRLYRIQRERNLPRGKRITLTSSYRSKPYLNFRHQMGEYRKPITKETLERALAALKGYEGG